MNKINSPPTTGTKKTTMYTKNLLFGFMLFELRMANNEKARRNIQKTRKLNCRVVISMSYNASLRSEIRLAKYSDEGTRASRGESFFNDLLYALKR